MGGRVEEPSFLVIQLRHSTAESGLGIANEKGYETRIMLRFGRADQPGGTQM
jgi:hypothetical protein